MKLKSLIPTLLLFAALPASAITLAGMWNNTTFASSGDLDFIYDVTPAGAITITLDVDGPVFGGSDPAPLIMTGTVTNPGTGAAVFGTTSTHAIFGDVSGTVTAFTAVHMDMINIPDVGIADATIDGTLAPAATPTSFDGTYRVNFTTMPQGPPEEGQDFAIGTLTAVPEPASASLFGLSSLVLLMRRRR